MSPSRVVDYWIQVGDELLADGEWHDGEKLMQKMQAAIAPGVAIRRTETVRQRTANAPAERQKPMSEHRQVLMGKRSMTVEHVHSRVRQGAWEVDPWPVPTGGWKHGGWRVRDIRMNRKGMPELTRHFRIDGAKLRELIERDPPLEYGMRGRLMFLPVTEMPALEERVKAYREESSERRRAGGRLRWQRVKAAEPTEISVTQLARRANISVGTAGKLRAENPDLGWVLHGTSVYKLPLSQLPAWDQVVAVYKNGYGERRAEANRRSAAVYHAARDRIFSADDAPPMG